MVFKLAVLPQLRFATGVLSNKTDIHVCVIVNKSAFANRSVNLELCSCMMQSLASHRDVNS